MAVRKTAGTHRGRGNPLGTTSGARCEDSRACARPLPRSPRSRGPPPGGHGEARGLPPHHGTGPGGVGEISACPPLHAHSRGTPAEAAPPHPAVPPPPPRDPHSLRRAGTSSGLRAAVAAPRGGLQPPSSSSSSRQHARSRSRMPSIASAGHGSARPGTAPTRSSPRRGPGPAEPGPGEGGGATPPRGGRGERGSRPRSFPGRGAPPRARCPGRGRGLRRPKRAPRASFAVPERFLVSALQAAFPKKSRAAQRRGRQENIGSAARVRRLAAPLLRVLRQTFTETWFLARSARQGTSHFWQGEK